MSKNVQKSYDDLLKTLGRSQVFQSTTSSLLNFFDQSIKDLDEIISKGDAVEKVLAGLAFAGGFRGFKLSDPNAGRAVTGKIGGRPDEETQARIGALQRVIEREQERLAKFAEIKAKERAALGKAEGESLLETEREIAQQRTRMLEEVNNTGVLSLKQFFEARRTIIETSLTGELGALQKKMESEADAFWLAEGRGDFDAQIAGQVQLEKLIGERLRLQSRAASDLVALNLQEQASTKKLAEEIEQVNIQLLELQGNSVEAAARRFQSSTADLRDRLVANREFGAVGNLDKAQAAVSAQAAFNKALDDQQETTARLQIAEERLQNSIRVGAISQLEGLKRLGDLRSTAADAAEASQSALERIASSSGIKALTLQAEQARAGLEKLRAESNLLAETFDTILKDSASSALTDFIDGTKSAKAAFLDFAESVRKGVNKLVADSLVTDFSKMLGISGDKGGPSRIAKAAAGLLGGGGSSGAGSSFLNFGSGSVPFEWTGAGFAEGTDYVPRTGLAMLHKGEAVIPAGENRGGGVVNVTINTPDIGSFRASKGQIAREIAELTGAGSKRR